MPRLLSNPTTGDDVTFLQQRLNGRPSALASLVVDGFLGPVTEKRVKEYQTDHGIAATGLVDEKTWSSLLGWTVKLTPGYFTLDRGIFDRLGNSVLLRGVNKMSVWDNDDPDGVTTFQEIKKTGANSVRIVWTTTVSSPPVPTDPARLNRLITNAKTNKLIPMIELHDATGNLGKLNDLVDYWIRPDIVAIVKRHEEYLLLNIGNEVGDERVTSKEFEAAYLNAVARIRGAGIRTPLVIDAPNWGQNLQALNDTAMALRASDPEGNLIFSVHTYWGIAVGFTPARIRWELTAATTLQYPLIVGEFSKFGAFAGGGSICSVGGEVDYQAILEVCHDLQIGWYAWEWGPGNSLGDPPDPLCVVMDMTPDRLFVNLKAGWAKEVATSSLYSIKNTSVTPTSM